MDTKIHHYLIWTIVVSCMLVHADIGGVHVGLHYQLQRCLCNSYSLHTCLAQQLLCFKSSLLRCLMFREPLADPHTEIRPFCGVINTGKQLISHTWHISVPSMFSLYINVLHFNLPMTPDCKFGTKVSVMLTSNHSEQTMHTYCGHRVPWELSFLQSQITLMYNTENTTPKGFHFVMTFQPFDITLPSVGITQLNKHETYQKSINSFNFGVSMKTEHKSFIACLSILQERRCIRIEIQLHIIVMVHLMISLYSSPEMFERMTIYDGPGILSPVVSSGPNNTFLDLSSYQANIKYSNEAHGGIINAYRYANSHSHINSKTLAWTVMRATKYCDLSHDGVSIRTQRNAACYIDHSIIITIHHMKFTGINMLHHSSSIAYHSATCQYGGLFVLKTPDTTEYFTICTNVKNRLVIPFTAYKGDARGTLFDWISEGIMGMVIFITFPGYSHGFIHLTTESDTDCYGTNFAIARGPSCNNHITAWDDDFGINVQGKQCTDLWLMNDIDYFAPSPFENCLFVFDHAQLGTLLGPFKMIAGSSTSVVYSRTFLVNAKSNTWVGNMNVEINIIKYLQDKTNMIKENFTVSLLTKNEYHFKSVAFTVFSITFSFREQFPLYAIRIMFAEDMICKDADNILQLYDSNLDVYLPNHHPYRIFPDRLEHLWGYNQGKCRILIVGSLCSPLVSHYQIIRIHYSPHKSLISPHEIDISLKKVSNCSIKCSLNVGILEYMDINSTVRSWHHEWQGIYRLTWQLIAAKSRGISITINSTCEACIKLCDIAVALGLPSYYNSSSVCLCVRSLSPPRSFDGSSPNLVAVCRWTSELPLRGSFSKRSTGRRVNGSLSLSTILYAPASCHTAAKGAFCCTASRWVIT